MKALSTGTFCLILCLGFFSSPALASGPDAAKAQPSVTFAKKKIKVGKQTLSVEIADSFERRARGLMFREKLSEGTGMLFAFESEDVLAFWMKNTLIPLAIGYFDKDQKLIDIQEMVPAAAGELNPRTYPSAKQSMFALEVPKGWFARHKIGLGTRFEYLP